MKFTPCKRTLLSIGLLLALSVFSAAKSPRISDMDTIFLTVSVTGKGNNAVPGIGRDRFQVLEDGVEQAITYFLEDSRPITVGFIFDDSQRMEVDNKYYVLEEAAQSFMETKDPRDEFFVVKMADTPAVAVSFSTDVAKLPIVYGSSGSTGLYEAVYVGLSVIKEAANARKILVVITSGGDGCRPPGGCNSSYKTTSAVMLEEFAFKQPVQIYTLFVLGTDDEAAQIDANLLDLLATMTGGRLYSAQNSARAVETLTAEIARGIKTQYLVGYKSTRPARDGKRRGVKVKVSSPEGSPKLDVWTKGGYYTRKNQAESIQHIQHDK